jgi:hypothetical protein
MLSIRFFRAAAGAFAVAGIVIAGIVLTGASRASASGTAPPLGGPSGATLTQSVTDAGQWQVTVPLDTAALCAKANPAGNKFILVTSGPNTVTGAGRPSYSYPGAAGSQVSAPPCGTVPRDPVTEVTLTFTPGPPLTGIPQGATLTVIPPEAQLAAGTAPTQIPLTVRRSVSPWQYAWIPLICGGVLALLLVTVLAWIGVSSPEWEKWEAERQQRERRRQPETEERRLAEALTPDGGDSNGRGEVIAAGVVITEPEHRPAHAASAHPATVLAGPEPNRKVHVTRDFWLTPLFAGATWSFSDSWVTSITPLGALAAGVATASGAVSGLVPGVDLSRFGLLMALAGGLTTLAPLVFAVVNWWFPSKAAPVHAPKGEVFAARLWVMLLAGCLTVAAIGAEVGFVGWVLGFELIVVSSSLRWIPPTAAVLAGLLFLGYSAHSILMLLGRPRCEDKDSSKRHSFMI